jgi:23S rRNA pseudouridine1911/1915/1917 synthase
MLRLTLHAAQPARLDQLLLEALRQKAPALSRARLKEAFHAGHILIHGRKAQASQQLVAGTHEVVIEGWDPYEAPPRAAASSQGCFLPVIHEDEDLLVLDKASGVPSLPHDALEERTAVGAALARFPELRASGGAPLEPGLLHRLDTGTSGLLAFAKTSAEYERLRAAWKTEVRKTYRALCAKAVAEPGSMEPQTLRLLLGHDAGSSKRMLAIDPQAMSERELESFVRRKMRGQALPTVTYLRQLLTVPGASAFAGSAAIQDATIEIETGVLHQIRCTLAYLGWPIVGDPIYGGAPSSRLWLHAWKLELPLKNGERLSLEAPLPEGWPNH